jgi:exonuclease III
MQQLARHCDKNLTKISMAYEKHQTTLDDHRFWSCWLWVTTYSCTDSIFHCTRPSLPPMEPYIGGVLISTYFLSPIILTFYELLIHPAFLAGSDIAHLHMLCLSHTLSLRIQLYLACINGCLKQIMHRARQTPSICHKHLTKWVPILATFVGMVTLSCAPLLIALLLILAGDVELNPGPVACNITSHNIPSTGPPPPAGQSMGQNATQAPLNSPISKDGPITREHLHILNWNCRGIDGKLSGLPQFLQTHDIHVAILTESRRSIGTHKSAQDFQSGGYTFYFLSHVDTSHSTSFINTRAREWGVCIAVRTGLAYQNVESHLAQFDARLQHGIIRIPTPQGHLVSIDILGAYAPARHEHKQAFWEKLHAYVQSLAPQYLTSTDKHLILAGDWNSYMDTERDIYRLDPSDLTLLTTGSANQHLRTFLEDLQEADLPLFDPMARDKLTAFNDFTFLSSNQKYRSIPDKLFTSFPALHCKPSRILEWDDTKALGLSDHRPIITKISLASLCSGWIEYPLSPITRPRITINADNITQERNNKVIAAVSTWKSTLPPHIAAVLLHDPAPNSSAEVSIDDLTSIHSHLTDLFVTIPGQCYTTGPQTQQKV